jgi:hypothetical protein
MLNSNILEREQKAEVKRKARFERKIELAALDESDIIRETMQIKEK